MKTNTLCIESPCDQSVTERPRFYARQLITADDLTLEQDYFRSRLRLHNRLLHGWGVVCGALVCLVPKSKKNGNDFEPWKVVVKPGYALGPYGDDINIDCTRIVDLRTRGVTGVTGEPCVDEKDPWCSEVFERRDDGPLFVAVRYKEIASRPVRVQPVGCGCDDTRCEYSRLRDGYEIGVLDYCPDTHENPPDNETLFSGPIPECPPCPDEPWVVLAEVTIGDDGKIESIDNCSCRRMVISFGHFWWQCEAAAAHQPGDQDGGGGPVRDEIRIDVVKSRDLLTPAREGALLVATGENLEHAVDVKFGEGVEVKDFKISENRELLATINIAKDAKPGPRTMEVWTKEPKRFAKENAITIAPEKEKLLTPSGSTKKAQKKR